MQHRSTNELNIIVNHVPCHLITTGFPMVVVDGLVAVNIEEVMSLGSELAIEFGGSHLNGLVLGKALCSLLNNGKHCGQHLVKFILDAI